MSTRDFSNSVALVTGANRGIGRAIVEQLIAAGVPKVYATARDTSKLPAFDGAQMGQVVPLQLDVTNPAQIEAAAEQAGDVTVVINNAGVAGRDDATHVSGVDTARFEMEANYFGLVYMGAAFAPVLTKNGGGTLANVLSIAGLANFPMFTTYSASKAAGHSLTQGQRQLFKGQGIHVAGVYPGPVETDMTAGMEFEMASPADVAQAILDGLARGDDYIFPDAMAAQFGEAYLGDPRSVEQQAAAMADL
jgi:NAD(P)-dependent dehydrogenase (short-subunit alcohol dehydrogenase family)